MAISLAIVDDKLINRQTAKDKLANCALVNLVLEAKNGVDFLEKLKQQKQQPDVVLMDLEMPEMNGIETIRLASAAYPEIKFIVLTVFEDNERIFEAIKAGANGYLLKEESGAQLIEAIKNVHEFNGIPMSPAIARKAMQLLRDMPTPPPAAEDEDVAVSISEVTAAQGLSSREMAVLKEMVSGKNYKAIGEKLFISPLTVRKHAANIYEKLHVSCRAQAINIAYKEKWV